MFDAELVERKRRFAHVFAETGKPLVAARASGIAVRSQTDPHTAQLIAEALRARLMRLTPQALTVLERMMNDEKVSPAVRRMAASDILDRAGLVSLTPQGAKPESLSAMSAESLRALVQRLESEMIERAKPALTIEHSPKDAKDAANPLAFLD